MGKTNKHRNDSSKVSTRSFRYFDGGVKFVKSSLGAQKDQTRSKSQKRSFRRRNKKAAFKSRRIRREQIQQATRDGDDDSDVDMQGEQSNLPVLTRDSRPCDVVKHMPLVIGSDDVSVLPPYILEGGILESLGAAKVQALFCSTAATDGFFDWSSKDWEEFKRLVDNTNMLLGCGYEEKRRPYNAGRDAVWKQVRVASLDDWMAGFRRILGKMHKHALMSPGCVVIAFGRPAGMIQQACLGDGTCRPEKIKHFVSAGRACGLSKWTRGLNLVTTPGGKICAPHASTSGINISKFTFHDESWCRFLSVGHPTGNQMIPRGFAKALFEPTFISLATDEGMEKIPYTSYRVPNDLIDVSDSDPQPIV